VVAWKRTLIQRLEAEDNFIVVGHINDNRQWNQPPGPRVEQNNYTTDEAYKFLRDLARYQNPDDKVYRLTFLAPRERQIVVDQCSQILFWYGGRIEWKSVLAFRTHTHMSNVDVSWFGPTPSARPDDQSDNSHYRGAIGFAPFA